MEGYMHIVALALAFLACGGFIWAHLEQCWKASSDELAVQPYYVCYGLWKICTYTEGGSQKTCDGYFGKTILEFNTPARVHMARASTIVGTILTGIGMFLVAAGSFCCKSTSVNEKQKRIYRCTSSWMFLVSGLGVMASTCWYASAIYIERQWYFASGTFGLQYNFGRGIYLGWASSLLALIAGICLSCCSGDGCGLLCMSGHSEYFYVSNKKDEQQKQLKIGPLPEYV